VTFVVTEQCIRCKFMNCIEPCPVNCFYEGPEFLVINPDECIDCNACATECPVNAIYQDKDLPAGQRDFIEINRGLSQIWPPAVAPCPPLPEREHWRSIPMKRQFLQPDVPAKPDSSENGVRT
jgi:ferredoxin